MNPGFVSKGHPLLHQPKWSGFAILTLPPGVKNQASQLRVCLAGVLQGLPGTWGNLKWGTLQMVSGSNDRSDLNKESN